MDGKNYELSMYDVECDNINNMLLKKEEIVKERVPVNVMNDNKYKELRSIIVKQKKTIKEQADRIKSLESVIPSTHNR
tara:strand:- start:849 stop:1082 length:234 start_codon:yes stop_codon:yes gene_type:complete